MMRFEEEIAYCIKSVNSKASILLYKRFPEHYVWNQKEKLWSERKRCVVDGRIVAAISVERERYHLRLFLNHVNDTTSFQD